MPASNRIDPILWLSVLALCVVGIAVIWLATWDLPSAESTARETDLSSVEDAAAPSVVFGLAHAGFTGGPPEH